MKRWNGWGDESIDYPLPISATRYLADRLGVGLRLEDASIQDVLRLIPHSTLPPHPLVSIESEERLRHARGQSLPDWIALRSGTVGAFPQGVACPVSDNQVRELIGYARAVGAKVIPYGGGTSVVGHINPRLQDDPVLTLDLSRFNHLLELDEVSQLATFEAGIVGPEIESQLKPRGYTLGHFPQSFEFSTLGGWVVTRSSGQQSYHYGRIENLFAGGHLETPLGSMDLPVYPASAAGPDLKQLILGSEGRLGILTRATVRLHSLPEVEEFYGVFFHTWEDGVAAVRQIAQTGISVSMMRLSNPVETATTLALSGKEELIDWADRGLRLFNFGEARTLMVLGVTGTSRQSRQARLEAIKVIRSHHGLMTGTIIGHMWEKSRFYSPYLRNSLWKAGYALDTLETALTWSQVEPTALEVLKVIHEGLQEVSERVLVFAHLSHVYRDGASLYVTYLFRRAEEPDETFHRWRVLKDAASRVIQSHGGTISHQHGVGLDHVKYLPSEKGPLGMDALNTIVTEFDPDGMMNPGKLLEN
jgi:alkyldihydroxyacetonephosphate synthase